MSASLSSSLGSSEELGASTAMLAPRAPPAHGALSLPLPLPLPSSPPLTSSWPLPEPSPELELVSI